MRNKSFQKEETYLPAVARLSGIPSVFSRLPEWELLPHSTREKGSTALVRTMNTVLRRAVIAPARVVQRRNMGGHHGPKPVYEGLEAKIRVYLPENHHVRANSFNPVLDALLRM